MKISHYIMILNKLLFLAFASIPFGGQAQSQEFPKHIMTGGPTGTYIQVGRDISGLFQSCGQSLNVEESAGSIENILAVRERRHTQFGIVQSDVLEFLRKFEADDAKVQDSLKGVGIALPLYNEEIHILTRKDIRSLSDLRGKRVGVGRDRSGTNLTASLVLTAAGITPGELVLEASSASLTGLLSGQLDAFFYVAGAPTKLFKNDQIDGSKFHFLSIPDPAIKERYTPTQLPANTYTWQTEPVDLVAVKAVLMTYDYDASKNSYHNSSCRAVSDLTNLVLKNIDRLKSEGHEKWQQVDFFDVPPGWDIPKCVLEGMNVEYMPVCSGVAPQACQLDLEQQYQCRLNGILGNPQTECCKSFLKQ